jgi:hypothetical protein
MAAKQQNKSDFIRAQPAALSVAEVIAKGKAEGIKFGSSLVYMVRRRSTVKAKKGGAETAPAGPATSPVKSSTSKTPSTKSTATSTKPPKSKADFVRAYAGLAPKEIVEKAKAESVKFDVSYVYRVRAMDKTARKKTRAAAKATTSTTTAMNGAVPSVTSAASLSSAEDLLRAVAAELGLGRAVEILLGERKRVRAVIGTS